MLDTKLCAPRLRQNLVRRPQLTARLDEGCRGPLVLVSAPAGFGKTTSVCEWVAARQSRAGDDTAGVAWLSLDAADSDPTRFLAYLLAAVRTVAPHVGEELAVKLRSPQPPPAEEVLTGLINEMAQSPRDVVLVLDDFHAADSAPVVQALEFLVQRLPATLHLVLVGREDPPLPLARWRAAGMLTELRAADLRFSVAETATLLATVQGLDLREEDVGALADRTEGWVAGLQLAAISLQGNPATADLVDRFTGSQRFVFDYLVEEVLQSRPEAQRRFLLQTAVLDRLRGDLCDALTGQHDGAQVLQRLEHDNVFVVALDDQRRWYRYHHLFADVLRVRLQAELPDDVAALHRRASVWFESMGMSVEAIGHALAAGDLDRAADLLQQTGAAVEEGSQAGTWLARARTLPERLIRERPALAVWFAYALLGTGELEAASSYLDDAESRLPGSPTDSAGFPGDGLRSLQGRIAVARAYLAAANGDSVAAVAHAGRALELVPAAEVARRDQATALLGMTYLADGDLRATDRVFTAYNRRLLAAGNLADAIGTGCLLADIRPVLGRLRLAVDTVAALEQAVLERAGAPPAEMADLYRAWAELDLVHGDVVAAGERLRRSGELGQLRAMPVWRYRWHLARARLRLAQGDHHAALDLLQEAQRLYVRTPMPDLRPVAAIRARIWAQQGRVGDALSWVRERGLSSADDLDLVHEFEHLALAVILLADSRIRGSRDSAEAAVALLDRLLRAAEDGGRMGSAIEILAVQATANHSLGDAGAAASALERALALAQPEGYLQVFLDQGRPMADLLREAAARQGSSGLAAFVLAAFPDPEVPLEVPPLSVREVEVLQHIAAGLTNQEIAALLFVSPYTVKAHARSIYDKLGAHSRTAAVARARALGILAPR